MDSFAYGPCLSVIIPVFNECGTLEEVVGRVLLLPWVRDILIVDDGSTDGTVLITSQLSRNPRVKLFRHGRNRGKGAAIRTALHFAGGEIIIIQDADLEYDPADIPSLLEPIVKGRADVVYGSRFVGSSSPGWGPTARFANRLLTWLSNRSTGLRLTDMETCYKAMRRSVAASFVLRENRFGFEPEMTAKVARHRWRVVEVPISYHPRKRSAGKKIGLLDGLRALWCIVRYSRWD